MRFDRDVFFEQYRRNFGVPRHQYVVDGLNRLLTGFETYYGWWDDIAQISNAFAQVGWETVHSYTPVVEAYYLGDPNKPNFFGGNTATVAAVQRKFWYWPHIGRGDIQLTHLDNYKDQDARVRKYFPERVTDFEQRTGQRFDLIKHPEQALDGWISFCIFTIGMHLGTFRPGRNLDRYITPTKTDHFNARDIVNGDKNYIKSGKKIGQHIADAAVRFERILAAALIAGSKLDDSEILQLTESIGPVSTEQEPAGSTNGLPEQPATYTVEEPEPEAVAGPGAVTGDGEVVETISETFETDEGTKTVEASVTTPAGDAPDAEPKGWLVLEDWKPFAARWLKRLWAGVSTVTLPGGFGLGMMALKDPPNWFIYVAIGVVVLIVIVVLALIVSAVLLAIWYFNRKEIAAGKMEAAKSLVDPNSKNLGVRIERK